MRSCRKGTWDILAAAPTGHRDVAVGFAGMSLRQSACADSCRAGSWARSPRLCFGGGLCHQGVLGQVYGMKRWKVTRWHSGICSGVPVAMALGLLVEN